MTFPRNFYVTVLSAQAMSFRELWRYSLARPNISEHIPNIFTNVLGVSRGGMTWKTYKQLTGNHVEQKAWHSISGKVAKAVAGKLIYKVYINESPDASIANRNLKSYNRSLKS